MYKSLLYATMLLILASCGNNAVERPAPALSPAQIAQQNQQTQASPLAGAASNIQHYYCPNQCVGSGGDAAGTCPVCGTTYEHNQAWHDAQVTQQTEQVAEPAQNAAGVWHYTCPQGCSGGAGSAVACSQCGTTLAHNQAYHN